jgi:hypothetical protein
VHRTVTGVERGRPERRPPVLRGEVDGGDGHAVLDAVDTGAFVDLRLQEFHEPRPLVGGGHDPDAAPRVAQHHAGGGTEQPRARSGHQAQHRVRVVAVDQARGEFAQRGNNLVSDTCHVRSIRPVEVRH